MARPGSRVRPLETPGNRRPREMIVAPLHGGAQNPAYRPSPTRVSSFPIVPVRLGAQDGVSVASASDPATEQIIRKWRDVRSDDPPAVDPAMFPRLALAARLGGRGAGAHREAASTHDTFRKVMRLANCPVRCRHQMYRATRMSGGPARLFVLLETDESTQSGLRARSRLACPNRRFV